MTWTVKTTTRPLSNPLLASAWKYTSLWMPRAFKLDETVVFGGIEILDNTGETFVLFEGGRLNSVYLRSAVRLHVVNRVRQCFYQLKVISLRFVVPAKHNCEADLLSDLEASKLRFVNEDVVPEN